MLPNDPRDRRKQIEKICQQLDDAKNLLQEPASVDDEDEELIPVPASADGEELP